MVQYAGAKGNKNKIIGITMCYQKIVATYSRYSDQREKTVHMGGLLPFGCMGLKLRKSGFNRRKKADGSMPVL